MEKKEKIEFIDSKVEKEEISGISFKGFIDGSLLTVTGVVRQIPFILFLVLLAVAYIANRYHAEKTIRQITALKRDVKDLRAEQLTRAFELMNLSKPSAVKKLLSDRKLELIVPDSPPKTITTKRK